MKKIFITIIISLCFYSLSFAQHSNFEFGVDAGVNASYVIHSASNGEDRSSAAAGFNFGISGEYYFSDSWGLKAKVIYDQKGWENGYLIMETNNGIADYTVNYKLNYITIPITANWHFGRNRNWYLDFGPYVGILTNAKATDKLIEFSIDETNAFNTVDAGVALGLGYKFKINNNTSFFIEYDGQGGAARLLKNTDFDSNVQNIRESFNIGFDF